MGKDQRRDHQKQGERGKKGKKIHARRTGDTCPICQREGAVVNRGDVYTTLGDGMAGWMHVFDPEVYLPLECRFCGSPFRKVSGVSRLIRALSVVPQILRGTRT